VIREVPHRSLSEPEVDYLKAHGCLAGDWRQVRVVEGNTLLPGNDDACPRIVRCSFYGRVLLHGNFAGTVDGSAGGEACGLFDSTVIDCVVTGPNVLIKGNQRLAHVVIESGAMVVGNGVVEGRGNAGDRERPYSCARVIRVGSEVLGRPVCVHPSSRMPEVLAQAFHSGSAHDTPSDASLGAQASDPSASAPMADGAYAARLLALVDAVHGNERDRATASKDSPVIYTIIGHDAIVQCCPRVVASFIGPFARLENSEVESSSLLSGREEATWVVEGSVVSRSLLQEGVAVRGHALVRDSLLMEHSSVDTGGKCSHVVLGPDSGVATGECHHSLVGPCVGFHHQSLLIAALWPRGRGNVAYGAQIGSNHTGRAADQECLVGEGIFFGLGVLVKLPVNLSHSPYSLVAAGTSLDQQRLHFPFSLIAASRDGAFLRQCLEDRMGDMETRADAPPILPNILRPAWVLRASPYTVFRNESKYMHRSKSRRHKAMVTEPIFRPEIIDMMVEARARLQQALGSRGGWDGKSTEKPFFSKKDLDGSGSNVVTWRGANEGVDTYTVWIKRYALRGLYDRLKNLEKEEMGINEGGVEEARKFNGNSFWEHQKPILLSMYSGEARITSPHAPSPRSEAAEKKSNADICAPDENVKISVLLSDLLDVEERIVRGVVRSKERDEIRGAEILDDYSATRPPLEDDKIIKGAKAGLVEIREFVDLHKGTYEALSLLDL